MDFYGGWYKETEDPHHPYNPSTTVCHFTPQETPDGSVVPLMGSGSLPRNGPVLRCSNSLCRGVRVRP